jgi:hypothetical protein
VNWENMVAETRRLAAKRNYEEEKEEELGKFQMR